MIFNELIWSDMKSPVAHQLLEIWVFLTKNGFVAVLKQVPVTPMAAIEAYGITGEQPAHHRGNRCSAGSQ